MFSKLKENLRKTKEAFDIKLSNVFANKKDINEIIDDIEETLILSDIGFETSTYICDNLRDALSKQIDKSEEAIKELLKQEMIKILDKNNVEENDDKKVIMVVGVNGVGKTTSIAKITNMYKKEGKKVSDCINAMLKDSLAYQIALVLIGTITITINFLLGSIIQYSLTLAVIYLPAFNA